MWRWHFPQFMVPSIVRCNQSSKDLQTITMFVGMILLWWKAVLEIVHKLFHFCFLSPQNILPETLRIVTMFKSETGQRCLRGVWSAVVLALDAHGSQSVFYIWIMTPDLQWGDPLNDVLVVFQPQDKTMPLLDYWLTVVKIEQKSGGWNGEVLCFETIIFMFRCDVFFLE